MSQHRNGRSRHSIRRSPEMEARLVLANEDGARILSLTQYLARELPTSVGMMVMGTVAHVQEYRGEFQPVDSGQVYQAVIRVPEGLGCNLWDSEEWVEQQLDPKGMPEASRNKFMPFSELPDNVKLKLMPFTGVLVNRLLDLTRYLPGT